MSPFKGALLILVNLLSLSFGSFSESGFGSGEDLVCSLLCTRPINRESLLNVSPASAESALNIQSDCSLNCTDTNIYSECRLCTYLGPTFPDNSIYPLEVPKSQVVGGSVLLNITGVSDNFTIQQTSRIFIDSFGGFFIPLDITGFSCSEIFIEYRLGSVLTENTVCFDYEPTAPSNISTSFESICDNGDISNASITIEWSNLNIKFSYWILQYNITLIPSKAGMSITAFAAKDASSITISNGPLLNTEYSLIITPYPGGTNSTIETFNTNLPDPFLEVNCETAIFDPVTVTYSIVLAWNITNYDCSLINRIRTFRVTPSSFLSYQHGFATGRTNLGGREIAPEPGNSSYRYVIHDFPVNSNGINYLELETFFYPGREPQLPGFSRLCQKRISAIPPNTITNITLTNFMHSGQNLASFAISWSAPVWINGHNVSYYLWIGENELPIDKRPEELRTQNGRILYEENIQGPVRSVQADRIRIFDLTTLHIQVLSTNDICMQTTPICYSSWSRPLIYEIPGHTGMDTLIPSGTVSSITQVTSNITSSPTQIPADSSNVLQQVMWPIIGGFVVIVVVVATIVIFCCFFGRKRDIKMDDPMMTIGDHKESLYTPYPAPFESLKIEEWEIPRALLDVFEDETLGSGCFGEVCKGNLQMQYVREKKRLNHQHDIHKKLGSMRMKEWLPVAVKKLKRTADGKEKADFLKEIDTMIKVSETKSELKRFVVNTLGCCRLHEPILLVVEYVPCGDLLRYLRNEKKKKGESNGDSNAIPVPYLEPVNEYSHLEPLNELSDVSGNLTSKHLLDFSRQIAAGMEFLSGLTIVHRDLACRNILVGADRTLKISDFGLARTVPQDEVYTLTNHGRLPLRWMAMESIFQREFTTASDVWSYGVVLWEICTMGKFPYSSLTEKDLLRLLKKGHRLEQPDNCSQEIYEIMHRCWHPNPSGRPSFLDLHKLFDYYLSKHTQEKYPYMEMDSNAPYTFDQLIPKSLFEYRAHRDEVLAIEELEKGEREGNESSSPPIIYLDNRASEFISNNPNSHPEGGSLTGNAHVGVYRLQGGRGAQQVPEVYDQLYCEEDSSYDREITDTLNSIYMNGPTEMTEEEAFYQDSLWYKKLSTITEVSNEDFNY